MRRDTEGALLESKLLIGRLDLIIGSICGNAENFVRTPFGSWNGIRHGVFFGFRVPLLRVLFPLFPFRESPLYIHMYIICMYVYIHTLTGTKCVPSSCKCVLTNRFSQRERKNLKPQASPLLSSLIIFTICLSHSLSPLTFGRGQAHNTTLYVWYELLLTHSRSCYFPCDITPFLPLLLLTPSTYSLRRWLNWVWYAFFVGSWSS